MRAIGKYYKTLLRDAATAETTFQFSYLSGDAKEYCENGLLLCKGRVPVIGSGIPISLNGEMKGKYFVVSGYHFADKEPSYVKEMLRYLTDNGLTDYQEDKVLEKCQNDISVLLQNRNLLDTVLARNKNKDKIKRKIHKKLKALVEQETFTEHLLKHGVELSKIESLYEHEISYEQYQKNPYLISVFYSISVYQADQFAYEVMKIHPYHSDRLCGYVLDAVLQQKQSGNSCIEFSVLKNIVNAKLRKSIYPDTCINYALLNYCIGRLSKYLSLHVVKEKVYVYENDAWNEETMIIANIHRLNNERRQWVENPQVALIEKGLEIRYNNGQRSAFDLLKTSGVKILTGPPGSGKTAILRGLIRSMELEYPDKQIRIQLSATTGRAAQVMSKSTGRKAETVNKMLQIRPYGDQLHGKNQSDPVDADMIIVDEVSMLGVKLAAALLAAIKTGSILLLVGDESQLQSVEYGNVLQDLIRSGSVEVCRLTEIMRQSGSICENAALINRGTVNLITDKSFHIHQCSEDEIKRMLFTLIKKPNTQVISSVKKGNLGVNVLNQEIQKRVNRGKVICLIYNHQVFYENDMVIMTETNYDKGYFNGDIGWIKGKDEEGIIVSFETKTLHLDKNDYHVMELAYAITTHRSQGSEFEHVHILLPRKPDNMLTRRIIYTAVTRAKKDVHIYSIDGAVEYAIKNIAETPRMSLLRDRL